MLRMLGQSEYGLYSLVGSVISYLTVLDLGFGNAIIRYTSKFRTENKVDEQYSMFGMFLVLYSGISLLTVILGAFLYFNIDALFAATMSSGEIYKARIMIILLIFNLAVTFPFSLFGSVITAYEDFIFQKVVQIIRILLSTVAMVVVLHYGYKAIALVVVTTAFNIFSLIINYWYCKHKIKIKIHFKKNDFKFLKEVSIYSFYIFLNAIMDRIYWSTGQFILGAVSGTVAVAVYSVAITLRQMYMNFTSVISGVFLPRVTSMVAQNKSDKEISDLFIRLGRLQFIVISFILSGFIVFGRQFIILWAGEEYSTAYVICLMFFIPLTVPLIQAIGITILQARNQMKFRSVTYIIIALLSIGISSSMAKQYGVLGCAAGTSIALIIGQVITMNIYYSRKQALAIGTFWKEIGKMSIFPVVYTALGYLLVSNYLQEIKFFDIIFAIFIYSIIYLFVFWMVGLNKYERQLIKKPVGKLYHYFKFRVLSNS